MAPRAKQWIPDLDLRFYDRTVLRKGNLCDRHMHAVHKMLQAAFPALGGLQSTLKSQTEFDPVTISRGYLPTGTCTYNIPVAACTYN